MATVVTVSRTNNSEIDGLLGGTKWSGTITYSFPDSPSDYPANYFGDGEPTTTGFSAAPFAMQQAIVYAVALISSYVSETIQFAGTDGSDIAIAQSPAANPTSYAYYPSNSPSGGDIWFGTSYNYSAAALGNYYFTTALHELGHALGLKHSQETGGVANVAVPTAHDDLEYTLMSYRSYVDAPLTGYTNEAYGYPQTYMANDILALQTLYGADFTTHGENTVYTWNPTTGQEFVNGVAQLAPGNGAGGSANRIFETIWDGNGIDTYDLSNYTTAVWINLNPGASSITSTTQLAYLGNGHYAVGNIYNAYSYNNDARSYIENAIGGLGNDTLIGNAIANNLNGGDGNDTLSAGAGNDTIVGGSGTDVAVFSGAHTSYLVNYNSATQTFTLTDQRTGSPDGTDTAIGVENFQFSDGTFASSTFSTPTLIEAFGSTSLTQVGSIYFLYGSGGSGPSLKYLGTAFVAGQFDGWMPIAAEQTPTGYQVAWKVTGTDQYTVWNADSSGNYSSNVIGAVPGASPALESLETSFHQDLNGDGVMGVPRPASIEALGSTSLTKVGNDFYLYTGGSGPSLKYDGSIVTAGRFGTWTPIGAEQIGSSYDVAWMDPSTGQYGVWSTDSNGNYVSSLTNGAVSGSSRVLQSLETTFHQDINGDGVIGAPTIVIQTNGTTSLTEVGINYYLYTSGAGPSLKSGVVAVTDGQFGAWTPIGAIQVSGGYDVAWKDPSTGQYGVWSTDSNGNYVSSLTNGAVSGSSPVLESLETTFHQDINGDGVIGVVTVVIQTNGTTSLTGVGNTYYLYTSGAGPSLKSGGVAVTDGQFGAWTPIGAIQVSGGYDVAWKDPSTGQYGVWSTDSNGNYVSSLTNGAVSGSSPVLKSLETTFHQDINGDGVIGVPTVVFEALGSTSLTKVGNDFYLYTGGSGPSLKYDGSIVTAGRFGTWTPIGAEQIGSSYDVAWMDPSTGQYGVWSTDSNGNYVSSLTNGAVSGSSRVLQSLETTFHQDINGDGVIGAPTIVIQTNGTTSLTEVGINYYLYTSGAGPSLKSGGVAVTDGQFGTWTPIGAIQVSGGYDVAWKDPSTGQYGVWSTDSNGNYVSSLTNGAVSGSSPVLESLETTFHQDINGDGTIGIPSSPASPTVAGTTPVNLPVTTGPDSFVFAPNFGQVTIANSTPATDTIQISQSIFATISALLAATNDDAHGNAAVTDAAHDTATIQHLTVAQLLAHQGDFHFV